VVLRPFIWLIAGGWLALESLARAAASAMRAYDALLSAVGRAAARCAMATIAALGTPGRVVRRLLAALWRRTVAGWLAVKAIGSRVVLGPLTQCSRWLLARSQAMVTFVRWGVSHIARPMRAAIAVVAKAAAAVRAAADAIGGRIGAGWRRLVAVLTPARRAIRALLEALRRARLRAWQVLRLNGARVIAEPLRRAIRWIRACSRPLTALISSGFRRLAAMSRVVVNILGATAVAARSAAIEISTRLHSTARQIAVGTRRVRAAIKQSVFGIRR
jgi:hypothetical protein